MKKLIVLFILLPFIFIKGQTLDVNNSTTTNLGANKIFSGIKTDMLSGNYSSITVFIYTNKSSAVNGCIVYFSTDGTVWQDSIYYTILPGAKNFNISARSHYYKLTYTNGTDSITAFSIQTIKWTNNNLSSDLKLDSLINGSLVLTDAKKSIYLDSLVNKDTSTYDFGGLWDKGYITIYDSSSTSADTVTIEQYSVVKGGWTQYAIGLRDLLTDNLESNNAWL